MSGIHLPDCRESLIDTPSIRYQKMRKVAGRFNIIQVGITMFHQIAPSSEEGVDKYEARTYNVFTFPSRGQITLEGSAVEFLLKNGMDWNAWFRDGVPYLRKEAAEKLKQKMFPDEENEGGEKGEEKKMEKEGNADGTTTTVNTPIKTTPRPMVLSKAEDIAFCQKAIEGVAEWSKRVPAENSIGDKEEEDKKYTEYTLPMCNSYLRRYLYQELERIYISSSTSSSSSYTMETRTPNPDRHWEKSITILRLSQDQLALRLKAIQAEKESTYKSKLGFRRIWTAITSSNRPVVVHNGLFDLLFLVEHMEGELPETLGEFKQIIGELFRGGVFDTRMVAGTVKVREEIEEEEEEDDDGKKEDDTIGKKEEEDTTKEEKSFRMVSMFPELRLDRLYALCKSQSDAAASAATVPAVPAEKETMETKTTDSTTPIISTTAASSSSTIGWERKSSHISVQFADGHDRYRDPSNAILHEAGYDSYITAFSFAYIGCVTEVIQCRSKIQDESKTKGNLKNDTNSKETSDATSKTTTTGENDTTAPSKSMEHLNKYKYKLPLYRSFYPGVDLTPNSYDRIAAMEGEQQYFFKGFPTEYQTSDVIRLFTTPASSSSTSNNTTKDIVMQEPSKEPSVSVRWIDDDSVVVRFSDEDAAMALANLATHNTIASNKGNDDGTQMANANQSQKSAPMTIIMLDLYMRSIDEKVEDSNNDDDNGVDSTLNSDDNKHKTGKKRGFDGDDGGVRSLMSPSTIKKGKIEN